MIRRPPRSTLFPSTPLSRSRRYQPATAPLYVRHPTGPEHRRLSIHRSRSSVGLHRVPCDRVRNGVPAGPAVGDRHAQRQPELPRSEEHTSELQSRSDLVCRLLLEKKKKIIKKLLKNDVIPDIITIKHF